VLDSDLHFDSTHGLQQVFSFGTGGQLTFTQNATGALGAGYKGNGTLRVADGIVVSSANGYLGYHSSSTGTATVTGAGSKWTTSYLHVGYYGNGVLNVEEGGQISNKYDGHIGCNSGSIGTVTITGTGSKLACTGDIYVGYYGTGELSIGGGGQVSSATGYLGQVLGSTGTATVTGINSKWTSNDVICVGYAGTGVLTIEAGAKIYSDGAYIGYRSLSNGAVTVTGAGSAWVDYEDFIIGQIGTGMLRIEAGAQVSNLNGILGYRAGSAGTVIVSGTGSKWTNTGDLSVGGWGGSGRLTVSDGGVVTATGNILAPLASLLGNGTISAHGAVLDVDLVVDATHELQPLNFGSGGVLSFNQDGTETFGVGYQGIGNLTITDGRTVRSTDGYLGYVEGSVGTATIVGSGSQWANSGYLYVGYFGNGTLNIGDAIAGGGQVTTGAVVLGSQIGGRGTCNLNGGALRVVGISGSQGTGSFNWNDGTIQNYDANTNLTFSSSLSAKLSATGTHTFYIEPGRTGTINAVLRDATSGGTLVKAGTGLLTLTAANSYTGGTTISAGTLALSSSGSLASSVIDVASGATFDVSAKSGGFTIAAGRTLKGSGTIIGSLTINGNHTPGNSPTGLPGIETVRGNYSMLGQLNLDLAGLAAGTGYDEVILPLNGSTNYSVTLGGTLVLNWDGMSGSDDKTKLWIIKNDTAGTLSGKFNNYASGAFVGNCDGRNWYLWYGANAANGDLSGGNDVVITVVPEPSTLGLLGMGGIGLIAFGWRRRK
jgi:T5SS/PEP-CTERM-associated repeat protein/autotransporter-associated beta strand protein